MTVWMIKEMQFLMANFASRSFYLGGLLIDIMRVRVLSNSHLSKCNLKFPALAFTEESLW